MWEVCENQVHQYMMKTSVRWEYVVMGEKMEKILSMMWLVPFTILKALCQALSQITGNRTAISTGLGCYTNKYLTPSMALKPTEIICTGRYSSTKYILSMRQSDGLNIFGTERQSAELGMAWGSEGAAIYFSENNWMSQLLCVGNGNGDNDHTLWPRCSPFAKDCFRLGDLFRVVRMFLLLQCFHTKVLCAK